MFRTDSYLQGNAAFGPLPIEPEPISLEEAGNGEYIASTSSLGLEANELLSPLGVGERSARRRGRPSGRVREMTENEVENDEEVGEGSTMDIEDD